MDRIDEQLVELLNRRASCAIEIGRIKQERGLAIYAPEREKQVLEHVSNRTQGPLDQDAIKRVFERIIDEARSIERVISERERAEAASGSDGDCHSV